ncbi:MAG: hypothetical protein FWD42_06000 [Solirubrobacterales bacterium]|nr:hypothetical protein [Solirubrobacterales bacterium]
MRRDSDPGRLAWAITLAVAVALVIANFAQQPLLGNDGEASGSQQPITLWVASADPSAEAQHVVQQAASRWDTPTRAASAEVLPGGSLEGVARFLERVRGDPRALLVLSSSTLAEIAWARARAPDSETSLRAQGVTGLLERAPVIAVVAADPLLLAVPRDSPLRSLQGLSSAAERSLATPFFSVAQDRFQTSNLAALVARYGLSGRIPYSVAASAHEAILDTEFGHASVALAPRSEIGAELRAGRMRALPWPRGQGRTPESWIAILGPTGLSPSQVASLRAQARRLYGGAAWDAVVRGDGLAPVSLGRAALGGFVAQRLARTILLERAAARKMLAF